MRSAETSSGLHERVADHAVLTLSMLSPPTAQRTGRAHKLLFGALFNVLTTDVDLDEGACSPNLVEAAPEYLAPALAQCSFSRRW